MIVPFTAWYAPTPITAAVPAEVSIWTASLNMVWRTVRPTTASTVSSPCVRKRLYSRFSWPKASTTLIIAMDSWTIAMLIAPSPRTR